MNLTDFLFEKTSLMEKGLILGPSSDGSKSFRVIFEESLKLASYLRRNIGQQKKIFLIAGNSHYFICAYLGIIKSENICVPLNPLIEPEVFNFIAGKSSATLGFFSEFVIKRLNPSVKFITENDLSEIVNDEIEMLDMEQDFDGNQIAEIIFTSGTTALPRGVMLSYNNIIANTTSIIGSLGLTGKDIMMVVLPFYYCYGLSLLHTHIRIGGSLVLNNNFIELGI